ncbi:hypothetical protein, partial [Neisseria sicca]|uniref:hypothetical protein n=1 Tax=Neisseria sicca TaxID=490 RepID=UPI001C9A29F4
MEWWGNGGLWVGWFMGGVGLEKEGFVGWVGMGWVLVVVVKGGFGEVWDVEEVFEGVLGGECLEGLGLWFWVWFWVRGFKWFR